MRFGAFLARFRWRGARCRVRGELERKTTIAAVGVAAAAVAVFALSMRFAADMAYPVERAGRFVSRHVVSRLRAMTSGAAAVRENARLRRDNAALALEMADLADLRAENARLRAALGFARKVGVERIAAEVVSVGGAAAGGRRIARLDKGAVDGIREGAAVETPDGLVGKIVSVSRRSSIVLLLPDPSLGVSCRIDAPEHLLAVVCGGSDDLLEMRHVSSGDGFLSRTDGGGFDGIPPQTRVVTSGSGGVFPAGIPVGVATGGKITPHVDFSSLETVFVRK